MKIRAGCLVAAVAMLAAGCNTGGAEAQQSDTRGAAEAARSSAGTREAPPIEEKRNARESWTPLAWIEFRDNTGAVFASMPFPPDWKRVKKTSPSDPTITGPNGVRISDYPLQSFMFTNDPNMQMIYRQSGQMLRPMPGIDQVIQQDLAPRLAEKGLKYVRHYEVPEVTNMDRWYSDQLYKAVPTRTDIAAIGTEWKTDDGRPYFVLLHLNMSTTAELQNWSYFCTSLSADAAHFERAKKQFLFALANTHYPLEPIMAYNQREAQKAGQSWAAHNQRMAANQAAFEARQRAFVNRSEAINEAINEAIMSGWRERNASSDRMQERTIDSIYERTNVVDPSTGQRYKVEAGANRYWMNGNGEYISSDKYTYDPNLDENMNGQRWQELQEVK
ncbi:MAG: hypothetical protein IT480_15370 [Gammaproteobacteria bacterium]|nr:hypothetical protein [Gammaproteobacteria bacterium]